MLRFLLGRAGTGKTETCLRESLRALSEDGPDGPPLVLLAPEQATFQLERALLDRHPHGQALARLQVLSFHRLAYEVLAETGDAAQPRLGAAGRRMALRAALRALRPNLAVFAASADRPGFAEAVAGQLRELAAYRLTPAALRTLAAQLPRDTAARLTDLAAVWEAYRRLLGDRVRDPGSDLAAAAAALPDSLFARAVCWVDGFAGFTPQEEELLAAWLRAGARLHVALCLDPDEDLPPSARADPADPLHPFAPTRSTIERLSRLARRVGLGAPQVERLRGTPPPRFAASPDLAALEAGLWRREPASAPRPKLEGPARPGVFLHSARDPRAEAEACAEQIDRLCRLEGYRYREVAVILHDLDGYHDLLSTACARRGIPLFIDRRRPAARHPVAQALLAAVAVVAADWSTAAVRSFLQTDLCGLDRTAADALDLLAVGRGVSGPDWYSERPLVATAPRPDPAGSRAAPEDTVGAQGPAAQPDWDAARRQMVAPLRVLQRALTTAGSARAAALACYHFLEELGAPAGVARWIREAEEAGAFDLAAWHRQCWDAVVAVLDEVALALGEEALPPAELSAALQSGLEDLTVGLVPPGLDQVLCGGVGRSRHPNIRVAFVLGVGDGRFPPAPREGALLGDADRIALREKGTDLAPTTAERWMHERFLAYVALTRASERLYLSYPAAAGPADLLLRVRAVVPGAAEWGPAEGPDARAGICALAGEVVLRQRTGDDTPEWRAAAAWLHADPHRLRRAEPVLASLQPPAPPALPPQLAARLYAADFSPTRLETMATCPFQHFGRYGLRLRERQEAGIEPSDLGVMLHAALAALVEGLLREGRNWADLTEAEIGSRCEGALRREARRVLDQLPSGSARGAHLLRAAGRDLHRAVAAMADHARAGHGRYRPVGVEIPLQGDLRGSIDRLDVARDDQGIVHVRVIDYKTGAAAFRLDAFAEGVDLAPVLYLDRALEARGERAVPGGIFTFSVRDELALVEGPAARAAPPLRLQGLAPAEQDARALHEAALDGSVTGVRTTKAGAPYKGAAVASRGQFDLLRRAARRRTSRLRAAVAEGRIAPHPHRTSAGSACTRCAFLAVCRFDLGQGDRYRWARRGDPWARMEAEEQAPGGGAG